MGTDKALLAIEGKTLLERAIRLIQPICTSILVSSNNPAHQQPGIKIIPDEIRNCGPLAGIYSCMKESETDWNFVISVDAVFVEPEFIRSLIAEIGAANVIVPLHTGGSEPLIALYHKNSLGAMQTMLETKDYKVNNLFGKVITKFVDTEGWLKEYPRLFHNLNRPKDI